MSVFASILGVMGHFIVGGVNGVRMKVSSNVLLFRSQSDISHRGIQVRDIKIMNDNASNGVTLTAPAAQGSNITHTLPGTAGNTGDVWTKKADGTVGYEAPGASGGISQWYAGDLKISTQVGNHGKWLYCNGQAVSRTTYAALFAQIGSTFGNGDGSTTFNVPDMRQRFPLGRIEPGGTMGQLGGASSVNLTTAMLPPHNHNFSSGTATGTGAYPVRGNSTLATSGHVTANAGSGDPVPTMPPYMQLHYFIFTG